MEKEIKGQVLGIDPEQYYKRILSNDKDGPQLHFIPASIARELSANAEFADVMLGHGYYNIRAAYAQIATNQDHIAVLLGDADWRVRLALLQNDAVPQRAVKEMRSDANPLVAKAAQARPAESCCASGILRRGT